MSSRLGVIAKYIDDGVGLIDVGTDHGYLPVMLAKAGYNGNLIASDINPLPLSSAINTAADEELGKRIDFILCDGLDDCPAEKIDTIVIAGMGGDTICGILDRAEWCMDARYKLILQPMSKAEVLRYWAVNNGFEIIAEDLVKDGGIIYSIIVLRFGGGTIISDAELFAGYLPLISDNELFVEHLDRLIRRFEAACAGLRSAETINAGKLKLTEEICTQLKAILKNKGAE